MGKQNLHKRNNKKWGINFSTKPEQRVLDVQLYRKLQEPAANSSNLQKYEKIAEEITAWLNQPCYEICNLFGDIEVIGSDDFYDCGFYDDRIDSVQEASRENKILLNEAVRHDEQLSKELEELEKRKQNLTEIEFFVRIGLDELRKFANIQTLKLFSKFRKADMTDETYTDQELNVLVVSLLACWSNGPK